MRHKSRVRRTKERETRMNNDNRPLRTYDFPADFCAAIRKEEEHARSDRD